MILAVRFLKPSIPGALVLVVGGIAAARLFDLGAHGVALVGHVPSGLPAPALPSTDIVRAEYPTIIIAAVALLLIGFSQTAGDARAFATRHRYRIDVDQESVAQGVANVGAGVFQGMPVSTSLSASSLNETAGARTPVASLVTGALVILTLIVLAPLFSDLPKAVLAAVIIDAVVFGMIDIAEFRRLWHVARFDFWISVAAVIGVLSAGVLAGVVIGIVLSLGWLISVATNPPIPELGREQGTQVFRDLNQHPGDETFAGIVILRLDSGLFFATSQALEDRVRELADAQGAALRAVVLDFEAVPYMDSQGSEQLREILEFVEAQNATLRLARVKPGVRAKLERDGLLEQIGGDRVHGNVHRAVEAQLGACRLEIRRRRGARLLRARGARAGRRSRPRPRRLPPASPSRAARRPRRTRGGCWSRARTACAPAASRRPRRRRRSPGSRGSHAPARAAATRSEGRAPIRTNSASAGTVSSSPVAASCSTSRSSRVSPPPPVIVVIVRTSMLGADSTVPTR